MDLVIISRFKNSKCFVEEEIVKHDADCGERLPTETVRQYLYRLHTSGILTKVPLELIRNVVLLYENARHTPQVQNHGKNPCFLFFTFDRSVLYKIAFFCIYYKFFLVLCLMIYIGKSNQLSGGIGHCEINSFIGFWASDEERFWLV